jgi:hypothetical protein
MRKADWKQNGYIFIPVFLEEDSDPEEIIKNSDFGTVWEVLQAMLDQDQRLQGIVSTMRILQGKGEEGTQAWKNAMTEYSEKIEFYDLPIKIDKSRFIEKLNTKIVEIIGRQWDFWYGLTLKYKEKTGNPNATRFYKTNEGFRLGFWQHNQMVTYRKGNLSPDRIRRLEEIGFIWETQEELFEKGFAETLLYKERTGIPNAVIDYKTAEGYRLGVWQCTLRSNYKRGRLLPDRIERLEKIGFTWDRLEEQFEKGFLETLCHKKNTSNPNATRFYKTNEGFSLGYWQSTQMATYRKGKLSPERIRRLEEIGFTWDRSEELFEKGFAETLLYKERTGIPNAPMRYKTMEGYSLRNWQSHQMEKYKKGKLSSDRIERLEKIGFIWDRLDEQFEKGFAETLLYKERTGNPNATRFYKTNEGFRLGFWQSHQMVTYRKGNLSPDRIERLEKIGFTWERQEELFEKGFAETLIYKERTGNPNASQSYKTPKGFRLGSWQNNQRTNYKKGKLSQDRIKRLEDIGFKWIR